MLSAREILLGVLLPLMMSGALGLIAWWRGWRWLLPIGAGMAFLSGYASSLGGGGFGLPGWPPRDGTDYLFWATLPAIALAAVSAQWPRWWSALFGLWAGVVVWLIVKPLSPGTVPATALWVLGLAAAVYGVAVVWAFSVAARRIGERTTALALAMVLGAAGILVLSSNLRTTGVYGMGAGAALAGSALFAGSLRCARPLAILGGALLVGLLAAGWYYPDPGISVWGAAGVALAPVVMWAGLLVPARRSRIRSLVAILATAVVLSAATLPSAIAAKNAAETDPYSSAK